MNEELDDEIQYSYRDYMACVQKHKIKIDKNGFLHMSRKNGLKPVYCPHSKNGLRAIPCGDHCALFGEPEVIPKTKTRYDNDIDLEGYYYHLRICSDIYLKTEDFTDER